MGLGVVRISEVGVVDKVSAQSAKAPVIAAVLEDVEQRHSAMAEAVHKQCLKFSLQIVPHPTQECQTVVCVEREREREGEKAER